MIEGGAEVIETSKESPFDNLTSGSQEKLVRFLQEADPMGGLDERAYLFRDSQDEVERASSTHRSKEFQYHPVVALMEDYPTPDKSGNLAKNASNSSSRYR